MEAQQLLVADGGVQQGIFLNIVYIARPHR